MKLPGLKPGDFYEGSKMGKRLNRTIAIVIFLILAIPFIIRFGGPSLLKLYLETGVGNCENIPILCRMPETDIITGDIDKNYIGQLTRFDFKHPNMEILMPKDFTVYKNEAKEVYFKRIKQRTGNQVAYLLYRKPNFFVTLFPELTRNHVKNDYEFLSRTMNADLNRVNGVVDTFFIIMKGIFTPDLGDQKNLKMIQFTLDDRKGFISYNLTPQVNYFDCNMFNSRGEFFKLYIKDRGATLNLEKVFSIISTIEAGTVKAVY